MALPIRLSFHPTFGFGAMCRCLVLFLLWGTALGFSAELSPSAASANAVEIDLRNLPDPDANFSCHIPLSQWRDLIDLWRNQGPQESVAPYLDPRAVSFLSPELLDRTQDFALSIWPDIAIGGIQSPVWMIGFRLDSAENADRFKNVLEEDLAKDSKPPFVRTLSGVRISTIDTPAKDLHFGTVSQTLLVSCNLEVMRAFLLLQSEDPLPRPPIESPATFSWRIHPPSPDRSGALSAVQQVLWKLGVHRCSCTCERTQPGYRWRLAFEGDFPSSPPYLEGEFDLGMVDEVPEEADLILLGGAPPVAEATRTEDLLALPNWAWSSVRNAFAFGVAVPDGTQTENLKARIAGAFRKPPPAIPLDMVPEGILPATSENLEPAERVAKFGELELALVERKDRLLFRNTLELTPPPSVREHLREMLLADSENPRPVFIGLLSPSFLCRPFDLEWDQRRQKSPSVFTDLWPWVRPQVETVDLIIFPNSPFLLEIELRSTSFFSPLLAILQTANLIRVLESGDLSPLDLWLGHLGPLPADTPQTTPNP